MWCCAACGLAQLTEDPTNASEPAAVEPEALRLQAAEAVEAVAQSGLLDQHRSGKVTEYGSPHGGTWLHLFTDRGMTIVDQSQTADVIVDSFGLMHEADQLEAMQKRVDGLAPDGMLLLQYASLEAIVEEKQWTALRHGHFAYFSLTSLLALLESAGLVALQAWEYGLYGRSVLVAATRSTSSLRQDRPATPDDSVAQILKREAELRLAEPSGLRGLQGGADQEVRQLRQALRTASESGRRVAAYGAASRAVALLSRAAVSPDQLVAVADASPTKQGRMMPGSRIPIISPQELVDSDADEVVLLLPDLLPEVTAAWPPLAGRLRLATDFYSE
jgi:hypothetical protein